MKIVIKLWLEDKIACLLFVILLITSTISSITSNVITKKISECISYHSSYIPILISIIELGIIVLILEAIFAYTSTISGSHFYMHLNNKFADKILDSDFELFMKYSTSGITTIYEATKMITDVGKDLRHIFNLGIKIIVTLISIYLISGWLLLPIIIIYGIAAWFLYHLYTIYKVYDDKFNVIRRKRNQNIYDMIEGFVELRTFHAQSHFRKQSRDFNIFVFDNLKERSKVDAWMNVIYYFTDIVIKVLSILYIISSIQKNRMNSATGMALIIYINNIFDPLESLIYIISDLSNKFTLIRDYDQFMNYQNRKHAYTKTLAGFQKEIKFHHVDFSYSNQSMLLRDINLCIKKGERIGICGSSGNGKSTLFKILHRFYVPTNGSITIDDVDLMEISEDSYRSIICSVNQENTIFQGTIKENIMYGSYDATDDEIIEASKKANLYNFIISLEQQFDSMVGPKGLKLSGGQKQRIALARMFLKNPDIILLDEATSALDNESEALIQDSLSNLREDQTIITIAHRLSTIKDCDVIYVIKDQKIAEFGTHDELIEKRGEYYKMYTAK